MSTGIDDHRLVNQLKIRFGPNPTAQSLFIDYGVHFSSIEYVRIIDNSGRVIWQENQAVSHLSLEAYPSGTYSLNIRSKTGKEVSYRVLKR